MTEMITLIVLVIVNAILAQFGQVLLKIGMNRVGFINLQSLKNIKSLIFKVAQTRELLIGLFLFAFAIFSWFFVLLRTELSIAQPLSSVGYILIMLLSFFYFKEPLTLHRIVGAAVIFFGILIIMFDKTIPLNLYLPLKNIPPFEYVLELLWR